ncbi:TPA: hypothetical protein EYG84_00565 [Candidatus Gracilibacteria bacterium]|nr:hypothetical protein [Candidatus Gracilibacteria bacterium]
MQSDSVINESVKGFMVESFIENGNQNVNKCIGLDDVKKGVSITDGCIGLKESIEMVKSLADRL